MSKANIQTWEERFTYEGYLFGTEPNEFLAREAHRLPPHADVLCIADGEGRNSTYLATLGHNVHAVEAAANALAKAHVLTDERGVAVTFEQADLEEWDWPVAAYDAVVAIFIQFTDPVGRAAMFERMAAALRPGGVLQLEGYGPKQLENGTGGPKHLDHFYTVDELCSAFADCEVLLLEAYDADLDEGPRHQGRSALVDLVARTPA